VKTLEQIYHYQAKETNHHKKLRNTRFNVVRQYFYVHREERRNLYWNREENKRVKRISPFYNSQ